MIFSLIVASLFVAAPAARIAPRHSPIVPGGRIVGGEATDIKLYPYQISLMQFDSHTCGGSIISSRLILTAGHCVESISPSDLTVRSGSSYLNGGKVSNVEKIIRHEKYGQNYYGIGVNDLALLLLAEPLTFDESTKAVALFDQNEEAVPGAMGTITGWGTTRSGASTLPYQLRVVSVPIISKDLCDSAYGRWGGLPANQICAAYYGQGGKDSCQGDSGGPLVVDGRQAGIVSWGNGCAEPYYPGVYTEVASFRSWIDEKIKQYENVDELIHL